MKKNGLISLLILFFLFLNAATLRAQLSGPGAESTENTQYPAFPDTDPIFIFCAPGESDQVAELEATAPSTGTGQFLWERYNPATASFEYYAEETDTPQSTISALEDGCYRVTITQGEATVTDRAWVFNNWYSANPRVTDSGCTSFKLSGDFSAPEMTYYDLENNTGITLSRELSFEWEEEGALIAEVQNPQIYSPPAKDTEYAFRLNDRFGCAATGRVTYESVVTKAAFSVDPQQGEAPLTVRFDNKSENGDYFKWALYKDLDVIKRETENTTGPYDSIMIEPINENPEYTYQNSGTYDVRLISTKQTDTGGEELLTCSDTVYLEGYIDVDTSFVAVPNVFTPNGDGTNDLFVVKFWSMKNLKISIFNRWGNRIHFWESDNVRGFEETYSETVWDGRLGRRYASPGVYYYVVEGRGRDDQKRRANGFFHLFRDKQ